MPFQKAYSLTGTKPVEKGICLGGRYGSIGDSVPREQVRFARNARTALTSPSIQ